MAQTAKRSSKRRPNRLRVASEDSPLGAFDVSGIRFRDRGGRETVPGGPQNSNARASLSRAGYAVAGQGVRTGGGGPPCGSGSTERWKAARTSLPSSRVPVYLVTSQPCNLGTSPQPESDRRPEWLLPRWAS